MDAILSRSLGTTSTEETVVVSVLFEDSYETCEEYEDFNTLNSYFANENDIVLDSWSQQKIRELWMSIDGKLD